MSAARPLLSAAFPRPWLALLLAVILAGVRAGGAETIPPAPPNHFNDFAGIVDRDTARRLNERLTRFERESSNQLLVAIYPKMQSDSSVEDYTVRVAEAWKAGKPGRDNGAVLFAFMAERQLYLQVGYGLEGAIPDALAKRIIDREIVPRFRQGDFAGGMTAAVDALIAASKGEYQGSGATVADGRRRPAGGNLVVTAIIILFVVIFFSRMFSRMTRMAGPLILGNPHRPWINSGNRGRSSWGGSSWGGRSGGGGGSFSGGGGRFGGGGAGGRW